MLIDQETLKMTKYEIVNRFNKSNGLSLGRKLSSAPPATLSYDANVPKSWLVYFRPKKREAAFLANLDVQHQLLLTGNVA